MSFVQNLLYLDENFAKFRMNSHQNRQESINV